MTRFSCIVDGSKVPTKDTLEVINPATGDVVGLSPIADKVLLDQTVAAANRAFEAWSRTSDRERALACEKLAEVLAANLPELARLLTQEQGKPLKGQGSEFELGGSIAWTQYTASLSLPVKVIRDDDDARIEQHRVPLGVVGSITPWNWPLMIAIWHIMPTIRSGNTVVIKPSPYTPLSSLRMVELMQEVLPPGVLNIVAGRDELGQWMSEHTGIAKVVFTGSTATGKKVMKSAASNLKRLTLELGGARVLCGEDPVAGPGFFIRFTIVADAVEGMRLVDEEQFGPVLPVIKYSDVDDAIDQANRGENGLGGSIWSSDYELAATLAARLECGTAWVNHHGTLAPNCPFGGRKQSGVGVEFGQEGLQEYTAIQILNISKL